MEGRSRAPALPNEIIEMIVKYFAEEPFPEAFTGPKCPYLYYEPDRETLKSLRLVNKAVFACATPHLFRVIGFGQKYETDVGRMQGLADSGRKCLSHMKILYLAPPHLDGLLRENGITAVKHEDLMADVLEACFRPYFNILEAFFISCSKRIQWLVVGCWFQRGFWECRYMRGRRVEPIGIFLEGVARLVAPLDGLEIEKLQLELDTFSPGCCLIRALNIDRAKVSARIKHICLSKRDISDDRMSEASHDIWDEDYPDLDDAEEILRDTISRVSCVELSVENNFGDFLSLPRATSLCNQLQILRLSDFGTLGDCLLNTLRAASGLRHCELVEIQNRSENYWSEIFDALNHLESLESVEMENLRGGGLTNYAHTIPVHIGIDYLDAEDNDRTYCRDSSKNPERPVETDYQTDYDAMQRLVFKLLNKNSCSIPKRNRMKTYLLPHCLKTREWLKTNDPHFKEILKKDPIWP